MDDKEFVEFLKELPENSKVYVKCNCPHQTCVRGWGYLCYINGHQHPILCFSMASEHNREFGVAYTLEEIDKIKTIEENSEGKQLSLFDVI